MTCAFGPSVAALATLAVSLGTVASGCADDPAESTPAPDDDEPDSDGVDDDGSIPPVSDAGTPIPSKIRYVLVLVKENHTFDNYFTGFPGAESSMTAKLSTGKTLTRTAAPTGPLPKDICHSNKCGQAAYANGAMNGFRHHGLGDPAVQLLRRKSDPELLAVCT
ncbi:hypothetical protein BH09MYX1_BH09MYX1_65110 [soil metagenome]